MKNHKTSAPSEQFDNAHTNTGRMLPFYFNFTLYNFFFLWQFNQLCWPRGSLNKPPAHRRAARLLPQHRVPQELGVTPWGRLELAACPGVDTQSSPWLWGPWASRQAAAAPAFPAASGWGKALGCVQSAVCEEGLLQNPSQASSEQPNPAQALRTRGNKTPFSSITLNDLICLWRRGFLRKQSNSFACP